MQRHAVVIHAQRADARAQPHFAAGLFKQRAVGAADGRVIGDAGAGHVQRADAGGVRFERAQLVGADLAQVGHAVGLAAPAQFREPLQFALVRRDDHLAAALRADAVLGAESVEPLRALHRHPRLRRAGPVIQPRVDHAAVVTALVPPDPRLLLQRNNAQPRMPPRQRHRRRKPQNARADYGYIRVESSCRHAHASPFMGRAAAFHTALTSNSNSCLFEFLLRIGWHATRSKPSSASSSA